MLTDRPSPNFGARKGGHPQPTISMLVIHYTGMRSCAAALDRLCDPTSAVSAHILIDDDGAVHRLVDDEHRAWHAGVSFWRGISDINSVSIGVELVNPGHEFGYRAFPDPQIRSLITVAGGIVAKYGIAPSHIVGHSDIAPGRKTDPGELFPWQRLASEGLGVWPGSEPRLGSNDPWMDLSAIGYAVPEPSLPGGDVLDPKSGEIDVITAFQRRFRPHDITGQLDSETRELIASVAALSS